jgi:glucose-1-phosphate cytidylyltransferase
MGITRAHPPDRAFSLTYGDGVTNFDVNAFVALHQREGRLAAITARQPPGRFGALEVDGARVLGFRETLLATDVESMAAALC